MIYALPDTTIQDLQCWPCTGKIIDFLTISVVKLSYSPGVSMAQILVSVSGLGAC